MFVEKKIWNLYKLHWNCFRIWALQIHINRSRRNFRLHGWESSSAENQNRINSKNHIWTLPQAVDPAKWTIALFHSETICGQAFDNIIVGSTVSSNFAINAYVVWTAAGNFDCCSFTEKLEWFLRKRSSFQADAVRIYFQYFIEHVPSPPAVWNICPNQLYNEN